LLAEGRLLFRDAGYIPELCEGMITLGPEQLALVGFGKYAADAYDMGSQTDVIIPGTIQPIEYNGMENTGKTIQVEVTPPAGSYIRIIMQQESPEGVPVRIAGGAPPDGIPMGQLLTITAKQDGASVPVSIEYDKQLWCGLSWAAGEITSVDIKPDVPLIIACTTQEKKDVHLVVKIYSVKYI